MTKEIRVLHVFGSLNRGGAETMVMNLYRNLDRTKIQFDFIKHTEEKCDYDNEIYQLGGEIFSIPRYTGKNHFEYVKAWDEFFKNHTEYRIIHGHVRSTAFIYLMIAKRYGLKTIAHSHSTASRGNRFEQLVKNIMQFPIRYTADYFFASSYQAGKWLFGRNAIKKDKYRIIRNAIEIEKYVFNSSIRNEVRKNLGIKGKFVIGHVGSFTYPKNHKFLIDVFYEVQKERENAILLLVGDGELRSQIETQISQYGLQDKVILTGAVPNVYDYMQAMDVFVFPSIFEGLGMSVIEAQVSGLKCIISDALPKEAEISDHIVRMLPKSSINDWRDIILKHDYKYERSNIDKAKVHEYDIKNNVLSMEKIYFKMVGED